MLYLGVFNALVLLRFAFAAASRKALYPLLLIGLFLFSAFRFEVGCDWTGYIYQFHGYNNIPTTELFANREPLWKGLIQLINYYELPYPWLNVASSAIFFLGMHVLARRQPDPLSFLVLLFPVLIINMPMSGIRQGVAIGIMGFAFAAFLDQRLIRFLVLTGIAGMFHSSAIVFFLMAPLVKGRYTKRKLMLAGVLALPGVALLLQTDSAELAVERYVNTGIDAAGAAFRLLILTCTGALYLWVLRKKWRYEFPYDFKLVTVCSLIMLGMILLIPLSTVIGDRLGYYLIPIQTMIFARIPFLSLGKTRQIWTFAPYAGLILMLAVWTTLSWHFSQCYLPYQTWLFGFPDGARFSF